MSHFGKNQDKKVFARFSRVPPNNLGPNEEDEQKTR